VSPEPSGSWNFDDADELFVFVHGFDTDDAGAQNQAYTTQLGLEPLRPSPVVAYSWDADVEWDTAKRTADVNGPLLAEWLSDWAASDGRPIHLIGYSLGARVCGEALRSLVGADHAHSLASVSLLGGAIPHTSVEQTGYYGDAIDAIETPVTNFHSRNDRVLGWVYRVSDRTRAVGHNGINDESAAPTGYRDVDVTSAVEDHYSYFQPAHGCLPQLVDTL